MRNRFLLAAVLLGCAVALRAQAPVYQIDLVPTGKLVAKDAPALKGSQYVFHRFPDGMLMSLRKSDVKKISQVSEQPRVPQRTDGIIQIGNLAMQGGTSQAGPTNARTVGAAKANSGLGGQGFYSNIVAGQTIADPNSANDYQVGRTFAGPPPNAVQSSPGAPPQAPQ